MFAKSAHGAGGMHRRGAEGEQEEVEERKKKKEDIWEDSGKNKGNQEDGAKRRAEDKGRMEELQHRNVVLQRCNIAKRCWHKRRNEIRAMTNTKGHIKQK